MVLLYKTQQKAQEVVDRLNILKGYPDDTTLNYLMYQQMPVSVDGFTHCILCEDLTTEDWYDSELALADGTATQEEMAQYLIDINYYGYG